jgi:PAS domain S-box-containing protein
MERIIPKIYRFELHIFFDATMPRSEGEIRPYPVNERLRFLLDLLESAAQPFAVALPDGRIVACNTAFAKMTGYKKDELSKLSWDKDITPVEYRKLEARKIAELIYTKNPVRYDKSYIRKDGTLIPVELLVHVVFDEELHITFLYAFITDLSERKRTEIALKQANRALKALSRCDEAVVHATDERSLLDEICRIMVEEGGYRMAWIGYAETGGVKAVRPMAQMGYENGYLEKVNVRWDDSDRGCGPTGSAIKSGAPHIIHNVQTDASFKPWREDAKNRGYASVLGLPLTSEGMTFGALTVYSAMPDAFDPDEVSLLKELSDDLAYGIMSLRARSRQRLAEESLRLSESRYRAIVDDQTELICRMLPDGTITFVNGAFSRYFDVPAGSMPGQSIERYIGRKSWKRMAEMISGFTPASPVAKTERKVKKRNGETSWHSWVNRGLFDESGVLREIQSVGRDTTERKLAEEALLNAKAEAELYLDLMGHDINNLNQSAMGYLELALEVFNKKGKLEETEKQLVMKPLEALNNSSQLIENVRKLQRARSGDAGLKELDMGSLIKEIAARYSGSPGVAIHRRYSQKKAYTVVANELLGDVFANIMGNAIKHSQDNVNIAVDIDEVAGHYKVSIEDDGPGIADDQKDKLFQRGQRGQTKATGRGLGLYLVRMLVESFGGSVHVEDRVRGDYSKGVRFVVLLPAAGQIK